MPLTEKKESGRFPPPFISNGMFADVILPLPLAESAFTYMVPEEMRPVITVGFRVIVPFGARKFYTGIVSRLHHEKPTGFTAKEIHSLVDSVPVVTGIQLSLWEWISFYYISPLGDVCNAALPSSLKLESRTTVSLSASFPDKGLLSSSETKIVDYLQHSPHTRIEEIGKMTGVKNVLPVVYSLIFRNIVNTEEDIHSKFTPKTQKIIRVNPRLNHTDIDSLIGKAEKQRQLFEQFCALMLDNCTGFIDRKALLQETKTSTAVLDGLISKRILEQTTSTVSRLNIDIPGTERKPYPLNAHQQQALSSIKETFAQKQVCLLHGVTSSGKTEIYIHLIAEAIKEGKQALFLVPEIALTTQLTQRLRGVFGARLGVYHSQVNDNERAEIWHKMLSPEPYEIVIGVRSSIFLPFKKLGLVIVDEEHESSYKQQEPSPRYHARDTAIVLAQLCGAKTLLGSATPSFESYYNGQTGKYGLIRLSKRFEEMPLPKIRLENTRELRRTKKMKSLFCPSLIHLVEEALSHGEQVILFRNRRGFAPMLECKSCGWTPKCKHCDVSLTYHKFRNELKCHYCNSTYKIPAECPVCHEKHIEILGQGTEQVEEEAKRLFPHAASARVDTDTTRGKNSYRNIFVDFESRKTQILIGTQMLAKGLDFDNVSVVGIISADSLLNHPDFRSYERGFQMMMQTSGRAGRKNKKGVVVIQTTDPAQPIYRFLERNDYQGFFMSQIAERKNFHYPPFYRLISITLKHRKEEVSENASLCMADALRQFLNDRVLGPVKPVVGKIQSFHIRQVLLKIETGASPQHVRRDILRAEKTMRENQDYKYIVLSYDVDPA